MNADRQKFNVLCVVLMDLTAILISYFSANYVRFHDVMENGLVLNNMVVVLSLLLIYIVIFFFRGSVGQLFTRGKWKEFVAVVKGNSYFLATLIIALFFVKKSSDFSRFVLLYIYVVNIILMYLFRMCYKLWIGKRYKDQHHCKYLVILTVKERAQEVLENIKNSGLWQYKVHSLILWDGEDSLVGSYIDDIPIRANRNNLISYAKKAVMDEILIHMPYNSGLDFYPLIDKLEDMGVKVHVNIQVFDMQLSGQNRKLQQMGPYYVTSFYKRDIDFSMEVQKRVLDIVGSVVGLVLTGIITVFLAPVLLLESPGPLIFSQIRVGKNGRRFKIYKFRSMYTDAEARKKDLMDQNQMQGGGLMFKMENDPRVTRVGRFIRKTSIDELPQFWNVLKGDMSLVGTRPPTLDEFELYKSRYKRRLSLRPGITGMWQVSGRSDISDFEKVLALDLEYIDNWSLALDIKILIETVLVVFLHKGAR